MTTALLAGAPLAFASAPLPTAAYRRSWLLEMLQDAAAGQRFYDLLAELAPRRARQLGRMRPRQAFMALVRVLADLFPIYEQLIDEDGDDGTSLEDLLHYGIPVEPIGFHPDNSTAVLDFAACTLGSNWAEARLDNCHRLVEGGLAEWAASWWQGPHRPDGSHYSDVIARIRAPRGFRFAGPWDALPDLARYVFNATGHDWLDVTLEEMGYSSNPPWALDEIRSLARGWKQAKPISEGIWKLARYIEKAPRRWLPVLDGALRGQAETLRQISQPGPGRGKTLIDVFAGELN